MKTKDEQLEIPLECYDTGALEIFTADKALDRLGKANYGDLARINKITWCVDGRRGWNNPYEIAGEKASMLGLYTYMYHGQPFTIDDAETLIKSKKELTHELFIAWAAKFNRAFHTGYHGQSLPRELWPFRYVKTFVNGNGSTMRPAYQMCDDRSSFVVVGVDRDKVDPRVVVNWSFLWREFLKRWSK